MCISSRDRLDPVYLPLADATLPDLSAEALQERRAAVAQLACEALQAQVPGDGALRVTERHIPGPAGAPPVRVVIYAPTLINGPLPALIHLHGGGLVMGTPENADQRNLCIAVEAGCVVVSVDYRLAPETPFPGAVEDAYAALQWVYDNAAELNINRDSLAVGGESAGGGLAAALALVARDRNEIPVRFQLLMYPMLDDRTGSTVDASPHVGEFVWTSGSNRFGWHAALGADAGSATVSAYAAPARATNLAGLSATFIAVGALDLFVVENLAYASRLVEAGVPTELHLYPGAPHGFDQIDSADAARACWQALIQALSRALHG